MRLLEYQAKTLLSKSGINIPQGRLIDDAYIFERDVILKAQVPTGNRGKHGGIVRVTDSDSMQKEIKRLKGSKIKGHTPEVILAEEVLEFTREHYFSLLVDREIESIRLLARINGGIDVEDAQDDVLSQVVALENIDQLADDLREFFGYDNSTRKTFSQFLHSAFGCLAENDALLLEINPLVFINGALVALDCKMEIDDNALFRHPELAGHKPDVNFVILNADGDTAVVANGAGLAMATVDEVCQADLAATNFLDIGGGADTEAITRQFERLASLPNLKSIIVNIFAGITRCDEVAEAIVAAQRKIIDLPPLFIRLHGTNYDDAKHILDKAGIRLFKSLNECIKAAKHV